uniref:Uncharacterized protein n=1 Tax=Psilocybe cubensis TaxID=181762 RepID=A0A8H7Y4A1_PSICU
MIIAHVLTSILKHKEMFQMIKVMAYLPGSIDSNVIVSGILISGNTIIENDQALRIKTKALATNSTVTNITYSVGSAV